MNLRDRSGAVAGVGVAFLVWAWMTVCLRCFVRIRLVRSFGIDDFVMIGALFCFTVFGIVSTIGTHYGTGRHMNDLEPPHIRIALLCWYLGELFYILSSSLAKISVGFFLLRIVSVPVQRRILFTAMAVTAVAGFCSFFVLIFQCSPSSYFWDQAVQPMSGHCMDKTTTTNTVIIYMSIGGACDFVFGLLPIWVVKELTIARRAKATAGVLLSMGAIAGIATIIRMPYVHNLATDSDFLWITTDIAIWSLIEVGLGISAGSLATTRPLMSRFFEKFAQGESTVPQTQVPTIGRGEQRPRRGWTTWELSLATGNERPIVTNDDEMPITGVMEGISESSIDRKIRQDSHPTLHSCEEFYDGEKRRIEGSSISSRHEAGQIRELEFMSTCFYLNRKKSSEEFEEETVKRPDKSNTT